LQIHKDPVVTAPNDYAHYLWGRENLSGVTVQFKGIFSVKRQPYSNSQLGGEELRTLAGTFTVVSNFAIDIQQDKKNGYEGGEEGKNEKKSAPKTSLETTCPAA
jgi:hypothetical protein